jgi:DNA-binding transcriptional LysR family regulator
MDKLESMRAFMSVADHSSFTLAGKQLNKSPASITRHVAMLEAELNMRLMSRSTRKLVLTEAGKRYLDGCRAVTKALEDMESDLMRTKHDPGGLLRIAAPAMFATTELASLLAAYRAFRRSVDFEVTTYDMPVNLIEGGFDVCFATNRYRVSESLVSRPLMTIKEVLVASPVYLAQRGEPDTPAGLTGHDLLTEHERSRTWTFAAASGTQQVAVNSILSVSSCAAMRAAALAHMGIALLPMPIVADDIARGRLVALLEHYPIKGGAQRLSLVYHERSFLTAKVRGFIDFVFERYRNAGANDASKPLRIVA